MWIKRIEIEGFRGYPANKQFKFNFGLKPFVFIFGNNKCGKSSLLNAIEWVIFGSDVGSEKNTKIPERKDWEIKNFNSSKTKVILTLEDSEKNEIAELTGELTGKKKTENYLKIIGQEENHRPSEFLNINIDDYFVSVHLHQEVLRQFITAKESDRKKALLRLLGFSFFEDIKDGIKEASRKADYLTRTTIPEEQKELEDRIENKVKNYKGKQDEIKQKYPEVNFSEADREPEKFLNEIYTETEKLLEDLYKEYSLKYQRWGKEKTAEKLQDFLDHVYDSIKSLRSSIPEFKEAEEISKKQERLKSFKGRISSLIEETKKFEEERRDLEEKFGIPEKLKEEVREIENEIEEIEKKIEEENALVNVYSQVLTWLDKIEKLEECPICGQKASKDKIISFINDRKEKFGEDVKELEEGKKKKEILKLEKKKIIKQFEDIEKQFLNIGERRTNLIEELSKFYGETLNEYIDLLNFIEKKEAELKNAKEKIENKLKLINEKIKNIEHNQSQKLRDLIEYIGIIDKVNKLSEKKHEISREFRQISNEIKDYVYALNEFSEKIEKLYEDKFREIFDSIRDIVNEIFAGITNRPDFKKVDLSEDFKILAKQNDEDEGKPVISFFNQGDMNAVALALFLSVAKKEPTHKLKFIILDDPSQSLDYEYKKNLVNVLNKISEQSDRQIIISTMDKEFQDLLRNEIKKEKLIINLKNWCPETGPEVAIE